MAQITAEQIRWFRLRRSGLIEPFDNPETAASAIVGVQAQILPAAGISLWNRTTGLSYTQFEDLLFNQRTLVKIWAQRGTLHLYPSQEWPLVSGALSGRLSWWERNAQNSDELERYREKVVQVLELLRQKQVIGRSDLRTADFDLHEAHLSSWGGIFYDLVKAGYACHAKSEGNEGLFAHREYWLPNLPWNPPAHEEANIQLFRRYLRAYAPATLQDFMYWRYAQAEPARRWFAALQDEIAEVTIDGKPMFVLKSDLEVLQETPPPSEAWPVRLLYRFEPYLLGHKDKSWVIDMPHYKQVWRPAGHIEGVVLENGRITATWRYDRKGNGLIVTVYPFKKLKRKTEKNLIQQANRLAQFFVLPLQDFIIQ